MSDTEQKETWPPPPSIPPPPAGNAKSPVPPVRGYRIGFVGLIALILTGFCGSLIPQLPLSGLVGVIVGMIGLGFSICGFLQSIRDIRSSAANSDRDGLVIGSLGIFLNVTTFLITCFIAFALALSR